MAKFEIQGDFSQMAEIIENYGKIARDAINATFNGEAPGQIKDAIKGFIPNSGRTFKGHRSNASSSQPFVHEVGNLSLDIIARGQWGYLIFPDEGRGSHNHTAHEFMRKGAEQATQGIIDSILSKIE